MHPKSSTYLIPLLLLVGCGGGGGGESGAPISLQGLWYETQSNPPNKYNNPAVILQNGRDVTIKHCNWTTTTLRLDGNRLVQTDGKNYIMQPDGEGSLSGVLVRTNLYMKRLSTATQFDSGRISLGLSSAAPLQASQDVCAQTIHSSYPRNDGVQWIAMGVMITAPYMGNYAQVKLVFDQAQALRAGDFVIRDRTSFVQTPLGGIHVEATSPAFVGSYGRDTLEFSTGQVRVGTAANGAYSLEGSLITATGAQIPLSAEFALERNP